MLFSIFGQRDPDFRNAAGFEKIFHLYSSKMIAICLSKTGDREMAQEIVQEIFKSLWERRDSIQMECPIENYLMRSLKFKIIDHFRKAKVEEKAKEEFLAISCPHDCSTELQVEFNELSANVEILMDRLPCQCRQILELRQNQGLSSSEIAARLMLSERMVNYHLAKSKDILRQELKKLYKSEK